MNEQPGADLISVPTGGGALRAIGETFQPDLHTGTGNYQIPLDLPRGRNGLTPQLTLSYSSGNGNGPFGLGWALASPAIVRKTDKRIPRYDGTDIFVLSGGEDLAPVPGGAQNAQHYRPKTETLFARIEHHTAPGSDYWQSWSPGGLLSTYGTPQPVGAGQNWTDPAIVADPEDAGHIHSWLITCTQDTFGNTIHYEYSPDQDNPTGAQRYLTKIKYADYGDPTDPTYLVEIRFNYEPRTDTVTSRRGGFPVSTAKRCSAIETCTNLAGTAQPTRTVALTYTDGTSRLEGNGVSLLARVTVTGRDNTATQSLPPLDLGYSLWDPTARRFQQLGGSATPDQSLASLGFDLADLFGDGLPDVLQVTAGTARYWRNRGSGQMDLPRSFADAPAGFAIGSQGVQVLDAAGDGRPDLVVTDGKRAGYFPLSAGSFDKTKYVPYDAAPAFGLTDASTRLIDLDGDGVVDALRIGANLQTYLNQGARGWVPQPAISGSPIANVSFSDPRIRLADMTGDGLTDIVQIGNKNIRYWPNTGYGRFGPPVTMMASPSFDDASLFGPVGFDPARLLLGDIDGDGVADAAYIGTHTTTIWINRTGQGFARPVIIPATPPFNTRSSVRLADMLGTGTTGVLFSYGAGEVRGSNYKFLDLTGGVKPYLLTRIDNHAGSITVIEYESSTAFAIADAAAGTPWRTTLPFPVQVVAATRKTDYFSNNTLTTEYAYHHGYWDGADREYRGFGCVDQKDTSNLASSTNVDPVQSPPTLTRTWFHLGPVGPEHGAWTQLDFTNEYWTGDPILASQVDLASLPASLPRRTLRDAIRAARGTSLRQELYALDGTPLASRPYEVSDHAIAIKPVLDGRASNDSSWLAHPVFNCEQTLARSTVWERGDDPMIRLQATGNYDDYGRPASSISLAAPRGHNPALPSASPEAYLATITTTEYATLDDATGYITDRPTRVHHAQLEAATTASTALNIIATALGGKSTQRTLTLSFTFYDGPPAAGPGCLPGQPGGLPYGHLGTHGLPTRTEQLAITPSQLSAASLPGNGDPGGAPPYLLPDGSVTAPSPPTYPPAFTAALPPSAGYTWHPDGADPGTGATYIAGYYRQASGYAYDVQQDPRGRGLLLYQRDPLGYDTAITYDTHRLLPATITDPNSLVHTAAYDYRVLRPDVIIDPNGNRTQIGYTPLGLPAWTASTGRNGANQGDTADQPSTIYTYDLEAYNDTAPARQPISVTTIRRVQHHWNMIDDINTERAAANQGPLSDAEIAELFPADEINKYPERFIKIREFSDGFGRLLQTRHQADPLTIDDLGLPPDQASAVTPARARQADPAACVVVTSWKLYDNKGRVIAAYEPFFETGYDYKPPGNGLLGTLAKITTTYDPRGLAVRVTTADGSQTRTVPGIPADLTNPDVYAPSPWISYLYDGDDNAGRTHPDASAFWSAQFNTPSSETVDALGRVVSHTQRAASSDDGAAITTTTYDIEGNVVSVTDALGRTAAATDFDSLKRAWRHASLDAGTTRSIYDPAGGVVETHDDKGALTLTSYDHAHRPDRLWAADRAGQSPTLRQVTIYGDQAESGLSNADAQTANLLGHIYHSYDESGLQQTPAYDLDGNPLTAGRRPLNPAVLISGLPAGAGTWDDTAYIVNWQPGPGDTLDTHASGMLDPTGYDTEIKYDALHRTIETTGPVDATGNRIRITYTHDPAGQITSITGDGILHLCRALYNARGQRTLAFLGNGTLLRYFHDPATFRLQRLRSEPAIYTGGPVTWTGTGKPVDVLQDYAYEYDLVGNLLALHDRTPGCGIRAGLNPAMSSGVDALDRVFTYDPFYRLTKATGRETAQSANPPWIDIPANTDPTTAQPYAETYDYDLTGGLTDLKHTSATGYVRAYTTLPGHNQLATVTTGTNTLNYGYDLVGNLTVEGNVRLHEWDHANRLTTFRTQTSGALPSVYAQYRYDSAGQRVMKIVKHPGSDPDITIYVGGTFERRILSGGTDHAVTHDDIHILDGSQRIAVLQKGTPLPRDPYPEATYQLGDHVGSSTTTLDAGGVLLNREEYTPYGETSFGSYTLKRYRFAAKERDEESSLIYYGARYYAPWLARWISTDPLSKESGSDYAYALDNPLRIVDPSGASGVEVQQVPVEPTPIIPESSPVAAEGVGTETVAGSEFAGATATSKYPVSWQAPEALSRGGGEVLSTSEAAAGVGVSFLERLVLGSVAVALFLLPLRSCQDLDTDVRSQPLKAPGVTGQDIQLPGLPSGPRLQLPPYAEGVFDLPGSPTKARLVDPLLPMSPMELAQAREWGLALEKMVRSVQEKGAYGDWHLTLQNERLPGGPLMRPDEVWVNPKSLEFFIADIYGGGKRDVQTPGGWESTAHADKGLGYVAHPAVRALMDAGYRFLGYTAITRPFWQGSEHMH